MFAMVITHINIVIFINKLYKSAKQVEVVNPKKKVCKGEKIILVKMTHLTNALTRIYMINIHTEFSCNVGPILGSMNL